MLKSLKSIRKHKLKARDGQIGSVDDFYFDDLSWTIRYLVADTGHWLPGRLILIAPASIADLDWHGREVRADLTVEQIENSPPIEEHRPISRQEESKLVRFYNWPPYWAAVPPVGGQPIPPETVQRELTQEKPADEKEDVHLRSFREVRGYSVQAMDGSVGHLEDMLIDDGDWTCHQVIVDTTNWWPGGHVALDARQVSHFDWHQQAIHFHLNREDIRHAPSFNKHQLEEARH